MSFVVGFLWWFGGVEGGEEEAGGRREGRMNRMKRMRRRGWRYPNLSTYHRYFFHVY